MTDTTEALRQARKAIRMLRAEDATDERIKAEALAAIDTALATEAAPIGYINRPDIARLSNYKATIWPGTNEIDAAPVYLTPQAAQAEPVAPNDWEHYPAVLRRAIDEHVASHPVSSRTASGRPFTRACLDVLAERRRQVEVEGWTPKHDDEHQGGGMAFAAAAYAVWSHAGPDMVRSLWNWTGWAKHWFKPKDARSNLIRAGALILAEIERLDRAAPAQGGQPERQQQSPRTTDWGNQRCDDGGM